MKYNKQNHRGMNYSRQNIYNKQQLYFQMQRMQNLLEQYDIENHILNKQILELLNTKKKIQDQYTTLQLKQILHQKNKYLLQDSYINIKNAKNYYVPKQFSDHLEKMQYPSQKNRSLSLNQVYNHKYQITTGNNGGKKNKTAVDELCQDQFDENNSLNHPQQKQINKKNTSIVVPNWLTQKSQEILQKNEPQKNEYEDSPQITSRFIDEKQLQKRKWQTLDSRNLMPTIKKDAYISSPDCTSQSKRSSVSPKISDSKLSSKSKKSKLSIVTPQMSSLEKRMQVQTQQTKVIPPPSEIAKPIDIQRKQLSPLTNKTKVHFFYHTPNKMVQNLKSPSKATQQTKNKITNLQYINVELVPKQHTKKQLFTYQQIEANSVITNKRNNAKNRSLSQHRIFPSQKIAYPEDTLLLRKQSQSIRGYSKDSKKKWINIVSNTMFANKLDHK